MDSPLLVTSAIIINNDKILLIKRGREPFKGKWSLIGGCGAFKHNLDPVEAVKIEVKIDINCEFQPTFFDYNFSEFELPTVTMFFHGTIAGEIQPSPKHVQEYKWFNFSEISSLELAFDHNEILDKFIK